MHYTLTFGCFVIDTPKGNSVCWKKFQQAKLTHSEVAIIKALILIDAE